MRSAREEEDVRLGLEEDNQCPRLYFLGSRRMFVRRIGVGSRLGALCDKRPRWFKSGSNSCRLGRSSCLMFGSEPGEQCLYNAFLLDFEVEDLAYHTTPRPNDMMSCCYHFFYRAIWTVISICFPLVVVLGTVLVEYGLSDQVWESGGLADPD